jgi:anti-sigma B factor antagonist
VLVVFRRVTGGGGRCVLSGLSAELKSTMSLTGFLDFFAHADTLEAAIAQLTP